MLNAIIRFALHQRLLIVAVALLALGYGGYQVFELPIDVFPDLNRPRVTVLTDVPGMAPEDIESQITLPLESAFNGAAGVQAVRSSSGMGLSIIYVEFDWGTNIYDDRQIVNEKIAQVEEQLPPGAHVSLAPMASIMGQIMQVGLYSRQTVETRVFSLPADVSTDTAQALDSGEFPASLRSELAANEVDLTRRFEIRQDQPGARWHLVELDADRWLAVILRDGQIEVHRMTSPVEVRTLADWVVRRRLMTIPGVAQVFVMGGGRKQYQVLVDPALLLDFGVTLAEVRRALEQSNTNVTGGYLDDQGPVELLVRGLGRIRSIDDVGELVVKLRGDRPVLLGQVARVVKRPQVKRGDSSAYAVRDGIASGGDAVVLTINKQPEGDTSKVTDAITAALEELSSSMPADVRIEPALYQQKQFIDVGVHNVFEALRDGGILVVIVLFIFLLNFRTTLITLTAIPLSIAVTIIVFDRFGLSINTMTLGGLAVAIGELVDDAIVDVENIYRRLRENRLRSRPLAPLLVVYRASTEIRNSIVFGTAIVVVVFLPLFALSGMEGRLFAPLGVAYIVSILSSLLVSLTVTPVMCYWLLPKARFMGRQKEGFVLRACQNMAARLIGVGLRFPTAVLGTAMLAVVLAVTTWAVMQRDFLPPFNEGAVQINVITPPGTSLAESRAVAKIVDRRLQAIEDVTAIVSRTGRAELDEHASGVNLTESIVSFDPESTRTREEILKEIRETLAEVPGIETTVEQPISHLISHMLSGVKAQIGIKVFGEDLDTLRRASQEIKTAIEGVEGVTDLVVEPQVIIPQLRIEHDFAALSQNGLTPGDVNDLIATAMNGQVVSPVIDGPRRFDLLLRFEEEAREDIESLRRLPLELPGGGSVPLGDVAKIYRAAGPNTINRERVQRRVVVQCNTQGRGLVDVVEDIRQRVEPIEAALGAGYRVEYGGQFESQRSASQRLAVLGVVSLVGMFLLLYTMFRSANFALQVMVALPMALIGSITALVLTGQTLTIAAIVGFISLCGIASRNGILLLNHYIHLVKFEGESWSPAMLVRAGRERLAPVLMTALTSGIGLVPLALAAGEPGKEILYPVATVIIGGLISSTLLEFLVRPALFWTTGMEAGRRLTQHQQEEIVLEEEHVESVGAAAAGGVSS